MDTQKASPGVEAGTESTIALNVTPSDQEDKLTSQTRKSNLKNNNEQITIKGSRRKSGDRDNNDNSISGNNHAAKLQQLLPPKQLNNHQRQHKQSPTNRANRRQNVTKSDHDNNRKPKSDGKQPERVHSELSVTVTATAVQEENRINTNLDEFANRALELKNEINAALDKQMNQLLIDLPASEVVELRESLLKLSLVGEDDKQTNRAVDKQSEKPSIDYDKRTQVELIKNGPKTAGQSNEQTTVTSERAWPSDSSNRGTLRELESLDDMNLDPDSQYIALSSSLQEQFVNVPHLLEPICRKLVQLSCRNNQLLVDCQNYRLENQKLASIREKLESLCRELQKANNSIRIESLELIRAEQGRAKEQTGKIQLTLAGVVKLFDENQQRNLNLRQENMELQSKLKSVLEHCNNWEKGVETFLKQRDMENKLLRTELAKANLLKNEEREKLLKEKEELLRMLSIMQEQQHKIEGQEAKLRSDLSSYATKYNECQAIISKGMSKFQVETKRMLKQLEKSRHDYMALLTKYESSNKKIAQLLEEKQRLDKALRMESKKNDTLEKLCRALRNATTGKNGKNDDGTGGSCRDNEDGGIGFVCLRKTKDEEEKPRSGEEATKGLAPDAADRLSESR